MAVPPTLQQIIQHHLKVPVTGPLWRSQHDDLSMHGSGEALEHPGHEQTEGLCGKVSAAVRPMLEPTGGAGGASQMNARDDSASPPHG